MNYRIINGDSKIELDKLEENSIDSIVTDVPYELGFMGKKWDKTGIAYDIEMWKKCLRVLKPGGYLLCFGGSRTFHRIACAIEDAGFEIRDTIMYLYGSGFPKSMNIGKNFTIKKANNKWDGWGTALKPAFEPIIMARKSIEDTVAKNVLKYGTGVINIDECRVGNKQKRTIPINAENIEIKQNGTMMDTLHTHQQHERVETDLGRFPANVITDGSDEVKENMPNDKEKKGKPYNYAGKEYHNKETSMFNGDKPQAPSNYNDGGNVCRYFYTAKASKKDRDEGLDMFEDKQIYANKEWGYGNNNGDNFGDRIANVTRKNVHPCVKPTELMQYLIRLVTPKSGTILDPFNGSGSTGKAAAFENRERNANYTYIGIELDTQYCEISKARIDYAINKYEYDLKKEQEKTGQLDMFECLKENE